jgi:cytoskeletal protein CcmA (bactofilin family)
MKILDAEERREDHARWGKAAFSSARGSGGMDNHHKPTVIGERLNIVGDVVAEGMAVELYGRIDGDVECGLLIVAPTGRLVGRATAQKVVVRGLVDGPIFAGELVLESQGQVRGDISCGTVVIVKGAFLEGHISQGATVRRAAVSPEAPGSQAPAH